MRLELGLEAAQDLDGLADGRLDHVDLLETARERVVSSLEHLAELGIGGGTDARRPPLASAGLSRLDASSVPPLAAPAPMMVWISSMKRMPLAFFAELLEHGPAEARLEVAAVLGAREQRPCRAK